MCVYEGVQTSTFLRKTVFDFSLFVYLLYIVVVIIFLFKTKQRPNFLLF